MGEEHEPTGGEAEPAFELDRDLRMEPDGGEAFRSEVSGAWSIGSVPNGGYLMALAAESLRRTLSLPDPVVVSGSYLEPAAAGPARLEVEVLRRGARLEVGTARLLQEGRLRCHFTGTFADLGAAQGPTEVLGGPPELPPLEACPAMPYVPRLMPVIAQRFDMRVPPAVMAWTQGQVGGAPEMGGWIRLADGRPPDALSLVLFADAFPPAIFPRRGPMGWVPTLELTVHVRGRPAPGWLRAWFRTRYVTHGFLEEDGEIWDSAGQLVAQSRQLARLVPPRPQMGASAV